MSEENKKVKTPERKEKKPYTIRFPPSDAAELEKMAREAGLTKAELIRRAINFYQIVIEAKKKGKRINLEDERGVREWVVV